MIECDDGVICGFCPLAMPSAASHLISLDLFSSGQRNGFDLASSCFGSVSLLVSYDLLDLSLLLCWSSCGVSIQNPGVFFSMISHYLETYALFLPACEPKGMQMDHFALDNLKAARMPRKGVEAK